MRRDDALPTSHPAPPMSRRISGRVAAALVLTLVTSAACGEDREGDANTPTTLLAAVDTTTPTTSDATDTSPPATADTTTSSTVAPTTTEPLLTPAVGDAAFAMYASGLRHPVDLAWRAGDPDPYAVQLEGKIVRIRGGSVAETALDLTGKVSLDDVQGLLGLTFHPTDALAYADFNAPDGSVVVAEYAVRSDGTFDPATQRVVISIPQQFPNHNGGQVAFGPDGYLYISVGDGSGGRDGLRNAQNLADLHGKILRIDPQPDGAAAYTIPADNPFVSTAGARPEIWAYGLRNPWRFSFDQLNGDVWIGDVGESRREELNLARAVDGGGRGVNFGWSAFEGSGPYNADQIAANHTPPVYEYAHGEGVCAVTGGVVYRGAAIPTLRAWHVVTDYCSGTLWAVHSDAGTPTQVITLGRKTSIVALANDPDGEVYLIDHSRGVVWKLIPG